MLGARRGIFQPRENGGLETGAGTGSWGVGQGTRPEQTKNMCRHTGGKWKATSVCFGKPAGGQATPSLEGSNGRAVGFLAHPA